MHRFWTILVFCSCAAPAKQLVVFDPTQLKTSTPETYHQRGTLDLSIKLKNANPFCASYQLKPSLAAYTPQPALAQLDAGAKSTAAPAAAAAPATKSEVDLILAPDADRVRRDDCSELLEPSHCPVLIAAAKAAAALSDAQVTIMNAQRDLSRNWVKCDSNRAPLVLKTQIDTIVRLKAVAYYDEKLDAAIADAAQAGNRAFTTAQSLKVALTTGATRLAGRKLAAAKAKDDLEAGIKSNKKAEEKTAEIKQLTEAARNADNELHQSQLGYDELDRVAGLVAAWVETLGKSQAAVKSALDTLRGDVATALALVPASGAAGEYLIARQVIEPGQLVSVEVVETKRVAGKLVEKGGDRSLGTKSYAVLRPINFDVGIGPAVALDWKRSYGVGANNTVIETDKATDLDAIFTLSGYYRPRYLDGSSFELGALIPRPMLGFSLKDPLSAVYLGLQLDPIQFLDISIGAKLYSRTELAGARVGDMAMVDKDGAALSPATRSRLDAAMFVSLTASSGLFTSWITALAK